MDKIFELGSRLSVAMDTNAMQEVNGFSVFKIPEGTIMANKGDIDIHLSTKGTEVTDIYGIINEIAFHISTSNKPVVVFGNIETVYNTLHELLDF